jgi:hypothetical protein
MTGKRKKSARRTEGSKSNIESTDSLFQRDRKRIKTRHNYYESSSSDTDSPVHKPAMTGKRKKSARRTEGPKSNIESTDSLFQRDRKHRKRSHNYPGSSRSDTERPRHTRTAEVQRTVGTAEKSYESQPDGRCEYGSSDEGQEVTGHTSVLYSCNERNRNSRENFLKTEVGSEEVATVSEHGALSTTKGRGTEAASLLSTSSSATADMSDGNNNEHLTDSPICSICIEKLITQQVGTTDTCNHKFCAACLQEWSTHANICPVDRQTFNFILVRHHLNGEIITRIPVKPKTQRIQIEDDVLLNYIYCQVCGEPNREYWILLCHCCGSGYHMDCLYPPLDTVPLAEWFCPDCVELN